MYRPQLEVYFNVILCQGQIQSGIKLEVEQHDCILFQSARRLDSGLGPDHFTLGGWLVDLLDLTENLTIFWLFD